MKKTTTNRIILAFVILQVVGSIVVFLFMINFLTDPNSRLNQNIVAAVQGYAKNLSPTIVAGTQGQPGESIKGESGNTGATGPKGEQGPKGDNGSNGNNGQNGDAVVGPKGDTGDQGPKGDAGTPAPLAQFRCNPETAHNEYKYPDDESWTDIGSLCTPVPAEQKGFVKW